MKGFGRALFFILIVIFIVSGCSNNQDGKGENNGDSSKQKGDEQYIFATGPTGGAFFPLGGTISEMWNNNIEGVNVTSQTTAAGLENLRLLQSDEAAFALLPESISYFGYTGTGIVEELDE